MSFLMNTIVRENLKDVFLYFAFGSNLLTDRIHINNPSASKLCVGKLEDYRLDFNSKSRRWKGAIATIANVKGEHVYGVLWKINNVDLKNLDRQEGVENGLYRPLDVSVQLPDGDFIEARSYQLVKVDFEDKRPSQKYLDVIIKGAKENELPKEYIAALEKIEHNGYNGEVGVNIPASKEIE